LQAWSRNQSGKSKDAAGARPSYSATAKNSASALDWVNGGLRVKSFLDRSAKLLISASLLFLICRSLTQESFFLRGHLQQRREARPFGGDLNNPEERRH
jgi:hypothetical protein